MEVTQEDLEHKIMNLLLEGDHPTLIVLRKQYAAAQVSSREFTGVGFIIHYAVPPDQPLAQPANFAGGNVDIQLENLPYGAGCVLFVRGGRLEMLDCYTHGDPWPDRIVIKSLSLQVSPIEQYRSNH